MKADQTVASAKGGCRRCGKLWDARNAMAVAAKHAERTGHETWAEQTLTAWWGNPHHQQERLPI